MNSKHVFRAFLTAGVILAGVYTGHSKTISANGTYEGEVVFLNSYGKITYKGATFKVKVPKGVNPSFLIIGKLEKVSAENWRQRSCI